MVALAGIPQGFVQFDTTAHMILKIMHEHGPQSNQSLCEALGGTKKKLSDVSTNVTRMIEYGLLYRIGRQRPRVGRSFGMFYYEKVYPREFRIINLTPNQRSQKSRARKAVAVASVFNFRGVIPVCNT